MRHGPLGAERAQRPIRFFTELGPGLITGAADDDPSGISTYSVAGAAFGYAPLWTALFSFPFLTSDHAVMGKRVNPPLLRWLGWAAAVVMTTATVGMFVTL